MSVRKSVEEVSALDDPCCDGKVGHRLIDILVIAICAVIAGEESWEDIALYSRSKVEWLGTFLALTNGIPAHHTFRRVLMLIDTERFEAWCPANARSVTSRTKSRRSRHSSTRSTSRAVSLH
jgi:hypothetical protein